MLLRRGRDVTIAKLAGSAFTARERTRFEEVDAGEIHTQLHTGAKRKYRETQPRVNMCIYWCSYSQYICIHVCIHIQTCLFVKINANELTGWQQIHQYWFDWCWQMDRSIFSVCIPLPFSNPEPCSGQELDRHSTIKPNEECAFNEEGGGLMVGGRLNRLLQICCTCRHADTYGNTHLETCKKTNKLTQHSKTLQHLSNIHTHANHTEPER